MPKLPPRADGPPILGNTLRALRDPLRFTLRCARHYGDVVDLNVPISPTILVSHPDLIEEILVRDHRAYAKDRSTRDLSGILGSGLLTSDGEPWRHRRRLVQPGFHRERIVSYGGIMVQCAERMLDGWAIGEVRDVHAEMMRLTREIVARALFDADVTREAQELDAALVAVNQRFADIPPGAPLLGSIPTPGKRRFDRARALLDDVIARLIAERRREPRGDLLSMLVSATDEAGDRLTDRQIRDEAMTLFLAGQETTALALSWTWVLLSRHPAVRERLSRELDEVLGGRAPATDDLPRLRYAEQVVQESMRLLPPAWAIGREALGPLTIGGYDIPRGMQVWVSQYVVHRDLRYYDNPDVFRPERWEGDLAKRLPRYAYFPFGGGPRVCIGNTFAMMEIVLLLCSITRRFWIDLVPEHPVIPSPVVTLRPKHGVRAALVRPAGYDSPACRQWGTQPVL